MSLDVYGPVGESFEEDWKAAEKDAEAAEKGTKRAPAAKKAGGDGASGDVPAGGRSAKKVKEKEPVADAPKKPVKEKSPPVDDEPDEEEGDEEDIEEESPKKKPAPKEKGKQDAKKPVLKEEPEEEGEEDDSSANEDGEDAEESDDSDDDEEDEEDEEDDDGESRSLKRLTKLATKLGLKITETDVTTPERVAFREQMAKKRNALRQEMESANAQIQAKANQLAEFHAKAKAIVSSVETGDFDAMAKAMGFQDFKAVNRHFFEKMADPVQKELIALRKEREQERAAFQRQQQEAAQLRAEKEREQLLAQHELEVKSDLESSKTWSKFAKDSGFVQTVLQIQQQSWDGQDIMSVEEAAEEAKHKAFKVYQNLSKLFGKPSGGDEEAETLPTSFVGKKRKRSIPSRRAPELKKRATNEEQSMSDWIKEWESKI